MLLQVDEYKAEEEEDDDEHEEDEKEERVAAAALESYESERYEGGYGNFTLFAKMLLSVLINFIVSSWPQLAELLVVIVAKHVLPFFDEERTNRFN